jgi:hypothetical protein
MTLRDLERHLRQQGCVLFREDGAHTVWLNPAGRKIASVRRGECAEQRHRASDRGGVDVLSACGFHFCVRSLFD